MSRSVYIIFKGGKDETLTGFVSFFYLHDTTRLLGRTERRRRKAKTLTVYSTISSDSERAVFRKLADSFQKNIRTFK